MKNLITITITPPRPSKTGMRYAAFLNDTRLCVSTDPFTTAARVLLREGVPPDAVLVMRREGGLTDCLKSTVGAAAGLTVRETQREGPMFVTYKGSSDGPQITPRPDRISPSAALRTLTPSSLSPVS